MHANSPYCLLHQNGTTVLARGQLSQHSLLSEMPRPDAPPSAEGHAATSLPVISMIPYAQLKERDYRVHDGGEQILSLRCASVDEIALTDVVPGEGEPELQIDGDILYEMDDATFTKKVASVIEDEIKQGEGSNVLLSRRSSVQLKAFDDRTAKTLFSRLARNEAHAYLTFCFFDGTRYFIGSSPERHLSVSESGTVKMNPICGTLRKKDLNSQADLIAFLCDPKEVNELFQVVDEELKMMSKICSAGGDVHGPFIREMRSLLHTEYELEGTTDLDVIHAFRVSMFAATMIGSPLENAARIIHKYEFSSRRYYSSALLIHHAHEGGRESIDSAITIRTMEISATGRCFIQSGASIVRDSVPEKECLEIRAKSEGLLKAIISSQTTLPILKNFMNEKVETILQSRNRYLSRFWLREQQGSPRPELAQLSLLIIDNEDEFTFMLRHMLQRMGVSVTVADYDTKDLDLNAADVVLVGPGPGNPENTEDPKIHRVHALVADLIKSKKKFLAVCLGHQVLCSQLGFKIIRADPPLQGVQKRVELYGRDEPCGFYNTFFAVASEPPPDQVTVAVEADERVSALRGPHYASFQFHVESLLTTNGMQILQDALLRLLDQPQPIG